MLAAIGRHYGFSRTDLEGLTVADMQFYVGTIALYHDKIGGG